MSADLDRQQTPPTPESRGMSRRQLLGLAAGGATVILGGTAVATLLRSGSGESGGTTPTTVAQPPPPQSPAPAIPSGRRLGHPFWTTPLPADAPLAETSAEYVRRLSYQASMGPDSSPVALGYGAPYNTMLNTADYSLCVYSMPPDWPRVKVFASSEKTGLQDVLDAGVPVPDPADLPDGAIAPQGTDGSIIILQGNELWELWQFSEGGPDGYAWTCDQGGHMADYRTHPGWWSGSAHFGGGEDGRVLGYDWGVAASGQSYLGGILTGEDFYAESINHPLPIALPITGEGSSTPTHILPATRFDQKNFSLASDEEADEFRLPHGARFRLPHDFDIESWVAERALPEAGDAGSPSDVLRKILICVRDYGLFVSDSGGVVGFSGEHEKVYGTRYHPYTAEQIPDWGNFGQQIPWDALVQTEVPTTDISLPEST